MAQLEIFDLHPLFDDVQLGHVFADDKTFVDCLHKRPLEEIAREYALAKDSPDFSLKEFVLSHFDPPAENLTHYVSDRDKGVLEDAETLWNVLTRRPDTAAAGTLIPLPFSYVVPGGRFREIYYWDSYFTSLGLQASDRIDMVENMVRNFSHLIDAIGYIPNGNRTYYLGRSQPPFYSLMVKLLAEDRGEGVLLKYLPQIEREYDFWMKGAADLNARRRSAHRAVRMPGGEVLNRYWDENQTARPESFQKDVELSRHSTQKPSTLFRHLRAGAESGWDFSSRWFKDGRSLGSIHTTEIVPVDLNCLLLSLEKTIAEACQAARNADGQERFENRCGEGSSDSKVLLERRPGLLFRLRYYARAAEGCNDAGRGVSFVFQDRNRGSSRESCPSDYRPLSHAWRRRHHPGNNRPAVGRSQWLGASAVDHDRWPRELRTS